MKKFHYKYLILVFAFTVFLDLLSTHRIASLLPREGLSILKIAAKENNPIVSFFWIQTNNLLLGEILDFAVKVGAVSIVVTSLVRWEKIPSFYDSLIIFFTLALSWLFFFGGFIHNTFYLYTGNQVSSTFVDLKWVIYFAIGTVGIILMTMAKRENKKYTFRLKS